MIPWSDLQERGKKMALAPFRDLKSNVSKYDLVREITITDFKLKYKNSVIGYLWSLLAPLSMLATLYVVFSIIMKMDVEHYQLFLLLGILLWNFFSEATTTSMRSLVDKANLIKKLNFSKTIIVLSSCLTASMTLILNLFVFLLFMAVFKVGLGFSALILPLYLAELFILALGLSFGLSALYVRYRDILHIWEVLLVIGFWITPIIYPISQVSSRWVRWYHLNPMGRIINDSRDALIFRFAPNILDFGSFKHYLITLFMTLGVLIVGYAVFKAMSPRFAEEI
ncbi:MAG: ABC transporter permease [archaeon]